MNIQVYGYALPINPSASLEEIRYGTSTYIPEL